MPRHATPPKATQRTFLSAIRHLFTAESFGSHLQAKGMPHSRIPKCFQMEMHLRFEELWELLHHVGPEGVEVILNYLGRPFGIVAVQMPEGQSETGRDIVRRALGLEVLSGDLSQAVLEATSEDSDGGANLTAEECRLIDSILEKIQKQTTETRGANRPLKAVAR